MTEIKTKFFTFDQRNSGGSFDHDAKAGIGYYVSVEALDEDHAKAIAQRIGIYFNGCATGQDCNCCGDRWSDYLEEGTDEPTIYGNIPIKGGWGIPSYIHYLDGGIEARPDEKVSE